MNKMITFEVISITASVLVFRGLWILMDKLAWFNSPTGLLISIALGAIIIIWSLSHVNRCLGKN